MNKDLKKKKSDGLLEWALEEQLEHDPDMIKYKSVNEADLPVPSPEYEKRVQELFKIADKVEKRPQRFRKYRQRAAGFALLLCISAFTVTQVEAFRLPFMRFFTEVKEKATLFGTDMENGKGLTEKYKEYEPRYTPAGFAVLEVQERDGRFRIKYLNDQKQQSYMYYYFETPRSVAIDTEDANTVEIEINGNQAYMVHEGEQVRILMNKDNKQFYIAGMIPYEEAEKVMESIK